MAAKTSWHRYGTKSTSLSPYVCVRTEAWAKVARPRVRQPLLTETYVYTYANVSTVTWWLWAWMVLKVDVLKRQKWTTNRCNTYGARVGAEWCNQRSINCRQQFINWYWIGVREVEHRERTAWGLGSTRWKGQSGAGLGNLQRCGDHILQNC